MSINDSKFEDNNDKYDELEDISINDFEDSNNDFEDILINSDNFESKAIVSVMPQSESNHLDTQIQDALKMSRLLKHNELKVYHCHDRSHRGLNEL
ncbi:8430_t:CDS:2 [Dentiscutata erythropus]|uniref:8430_t:CDS:1 n=1 Tax=Dentiscutata erythropus TaxID=1348616 RepID=A0A9N9J1A6_9GLOM|nr:8430_t:CDS:2 [Dentiscutata erythropus]